MIISKLAPRLVFSSLKRIQALSCNTQLLQRKMSFSFSVVGSPKQIIRVHQNRALNFKTLYSMAKKKEDKKEKKEKEKAKIKEQLGGEIEEIDLTRFEEPYIKIQVNYKDFLAKVKACRLDSSSFEEVEVKIGKEKLKISYLAQIAPKSVVSVIVNPYDSDNLDSIEKAIVAYDDFLEVKKIEKTLLVSLPNNSAKELKQKSVEKVKKSLNNQKQILKKERHCTQEQLKKYKKVTQQDQLRRIEKQMKDIFDRYVENLEKMCKEKEKQLMK